MNLIRCNRLPGKQSQWKDKKCVCNTKEVAEKFWGSEGTKGEGQTAGGVEEDPPMEASEEDAPNPQLSLLTAGKASLKSSFGHNSIHPTVYNVYNGLNRFSQQCLKTCLAYIAWFYL